MRHCRGYLIIVYLFGIVLGAFGVFSLMLSSQFNKYNKYTFSQLLKVGVHVGHSIAGSSVYAALIIHGYRSGICLINVSKFMHMFRIGLFVIGGVLARSKPVWFVTKEAALGRYLRFFANKCGEFSSTFFWVRGMLSNYKVLSTVADNYFAMPELIKNRKSFLFDTNFDVWLFSRYTWPGLVFVSSIFSNYFVINEALVSQIPSMGI